MKRKEIIELHENIVSALNIGRFKTAIDDFSRLVRNAGKTNYFYELENLDENYRTLLKYSFEGYKDPERESILNRIAREILSRADEIRYDFLEQESTLRMAEKLLLASEFDTDSSTVSEKLQEYQFRLNIGDTIAVETVSIEEAVSVDQLFRLLWSSRKFSKEHESFIRYICHSSKIPWYQKSLVTSAIMLSLLNYFDPVKMLLLAEIAEQHEKQVAQRALIGLVIGLIAYDTRLKHYPEIGNQLRVFLNDRDIQLDVQTIFLQLLLARETEKITKEFEEEVLPEMKKMMPRIEDKLQMGNLTEDDDLEGKNPKWKEMLEEVPGLFERIEKFTRMQMEGADVFMGTFSMLKRFDFFNKMSNWFVPYYADHPDMRTSGNGEPDLISRLVEGLEKAFYICNSDKYSFVLNFQAIPQQQQSMIVTHFEAELQQMKEMASEEELLGQETGTNNIFTQYIQDLYRFYKLYPFHNEFEDIFQKKFRFSGLTFYREYFEKEIFTERLAAFYFDNVHYQEAAEIYEYLATNNQPKAEYFEKIGYSMQKLGKMKEAIGFYRKAELFDSDRLWILKKLGFCSLKLKDYENALRFFEDAALLKPEDLKLQAQIGQCYISLQQYEKALEHFAKVRFYQPDDLKVLRPVAYCHFVLGMLKDAAGFYDTILDSSSATSYDRMNAGHVQLCLGNKVKALEHYRNCFSDKNFPKEIFKESFLEDAAFLVKNGIPEEELPLILDYLLYQGD